MKIWRIVSLSLEYVVEGKRTMLRRWVFSSREMISSINSEAWAQSWVTIASYAAWSFSSTPSKLQLRGRLPSVKKSMGPTSGGFCLRLQCFAVDSARGRDGICAGMMSMASNESQPVETRCKTLYHDKKQTTLHTVCTPYTDFPRSCPEAPVPEN